MKRKAKIAIVVFLMMIGLFTCAHHKRAASSGKSEVMSVEARPLTSTLFYSGVIGPMKTMVITSPADGVISNMTFHYGDVVKSNQILFSISSEKFQTDYKAALTQYIKAKTEFENGKSQLRESEFLHKNQLISDDDFNAKKTGFYNAQLTMIQSKETLGGMLKQIDLKGFNLYDLKIEDIDKITQLMHAQNGSQQLVISAPLSGIILLPVKEDGSDGEIKKLAKGDQIKQGDVLGMIGNVDGLSIHINVSEFNINQLKVGQKVEITGAAFPDFTLQGEIAGLNHQGQTSQGGLPTFPVEIVVRTLTPQQQAVIHMGMSAKVAIQTGGGAPEISIPIRAVVQKNGGTFVNVKDNQSGRIHEVAVKTGETSMDSVIIQSNLAAGDKIVVPG